MRLLLDTHALIWWTLDASFLTTAARDAIASGEQIYVSAASAFEMALKHRLGKLPEVTVLLQDFEAKLDAEGFTRLPITVADGLAAGRLAPPHKDPWDRMLIAQALGHDLIIVSNEAVFDAYGVNRLW